MFFSDEEKTAILLILKILKQMTKCIKYLKKGKHTII
jgi:hypothetical protein